MKIIDLQEQVDALTADNAALVDKHAALLRRELQRINALTEEKATLVAENERLRRKLEGSGA